MSSEPPVALDSILPSLLPFLSFENTCYVPGTVLGSTVVNEADRTLTLPSSYSSKRQIITIKCNIQPLSWW